MNQVNIWSNRSSDVPTNNLSCRTGSWSDQRLQLQWSGRWLPQRQPEPARHPEEWTCSLLCVPLPAGCHKNKAACPVQENKCQARCRMLLPSSWGCLQTKPHHWGVGVAIWCLQPIVDHVVVGVGHPGTAAPVSTIGFGTVHQVLLTQGHQLTCLLIQLPLYCTSSTESPARATVTL